MLILWCLLLSRTRFLLGVMQCVDFFFFMIYQLNEIIESQVLYFKDNYHLLGVRKVADNLISYLIMLTYALKSPTLLCRRYTSSHHCLLVPFLILLLNNITNI